VPTAPRMPSATLSFCVCLAKRRACLLVAVCHLFSFCLPARSTASGHLGDRKRALHLLRDTENFAAGTGYPAWFLNVAWFGFLSIRVNFMVPIFFAVSSGLTPGSVLRSLGVTRKIASGVLIRAALKKGDRDIWLGDGRSCRRGTLSTAWYAHRCHLVWPPFNAHTASLAQRFLVVCACA